jgi:hypothetical protein
LTTDSTALPMAVPMLQPTAPPRAWPMAIPMRPSVNAILPPPSTAESSAGETF